MDREKDIFQLDDVSFQYYKGDVKNHKVAGETNLKALFDAIKEPSPESRELIEQIRKAGGREKAELKAKLISVTPCRVVNKYNHQDNTKHFTGLLALDFDKITTNEAIKYKGLIHKDFSCVVASWLSSSSKGFRALIRIPIVKDKDEFKSHYRAIRKKLIELNYPKSDDQLINSGQKMYLSYDRHILINPEPTVCTDTFEPITKKDIIPISESTVLSPSRAEKRASAIFTQAINNIIDGEGHTTVRKYASILGGMAKAGYITLVWAESLAANVIRANKYLSKDHKGYIKTSRTAINTATEPYYLTDPYKEALNIDGVSKGQNAYFFYVNGRKNSISISQAILQNGKMFFSEYSSNNYPDVVFSQVQNIRV